MKTIFLMAVALAVALCLPEASMAASCGVPQNAASMKESVGKMLESARRQAGAGRMRRNTRLDQAAQAQACFIGQNGYSRAHPHRGRNGSNSMDRVLATGYRSCLTAENMAVNFTTAQGAVDVWMNSPGHRSNIMLGPIKEYGMGLAMYGTQLVWVMVFAKPC